MKRIYLLFCFIAASAITKSLSASVHSHHVIPPPMAYADYSLIFQKGWDDSIAARAPNYYLPAGRWPCAHVLFGKRIENSKYTFWTTSLIGTGTAGEADGWGTILDYTQYPEVAFGIGEQCGKGVIIKGIQIWGAFRMNYPDSGAQQFYNSSFISYGDGKCRDSRFSPASGIVIDPFGPSVPPDGGFQGSDAYGNPLKKFYFGGTYGSTGIHLTEDFIRNWVVDVITSPNGSTKNADNLTFDFLQVANSKTNFAGCQDQEKNNVISHIESWGQSWMVFCTNIYGAGTPGEWTLSHFSLAGRNHDFIYNNEGGYFTVSADHIFAESLKRLGYWCSTNGAVLRDSKIGFAGPDECGSFTPDMLSGYGVTIDGGQMRIYGWPALKVTIATGSGANNFHFMNMSLENGVPIYPQTYPYGYSDFFNCTLNGQSSVNVLNPPGPQGVTSIYAYPSTSNLAAKNYYIGVSGKFLRVGPKFETSFSSDSTVAVNDPITATTDGITFIAAGVVTAVSGKQFIVSYTAPEIDMSKKYHLYKWKTILK